MAVLVFSGGNTLSIPTTPEGVIQSLTHAQGGYCALTTGDRTVYVNPSQVAYIDAEEVQQPVLDRAM